MKRILNEWRQFLSEGISLPEILYHGTTEEFGEFDVGKQGRRDTGNLGRGIYLSTDSDIAMRYAEDNAKKFGGEPIVLGVEHRLNNVADFNEVKPRLKSELYIQFPPSGQDKERAEKLRKWFLDNGYDAAKSGDHEVVVFDESKVKIKGKADVLSSEEQFRQDARKTAIELGLDLEELGLAESKIRDRVK